VRADTGPFAINEPINAHVVCYADVYQPIATGFLPSLPAAIGAEGDVGNASKVSLGKAKDKPGNAESTPNSFVVSPLN
jgi:hypothetical protein